MINLKSNIVLILRGYHLEQVLTLMDVLNDSRYIKNVEITLNSEGAISIIKEIIQRYPTLCVGAGTVITFEQLKEVIDAKAKFVLSPSGYSPEMIDYAIKHNVTVVPGALTPTEIYKQHVLKASIIKVFPANEYSCNYAKKLKEPVEDLKLMAVGGVTADNVINYLKGGYQYIGTAGGIFKKEHILHQDVEKLKQDLHYFEAKLDEYYKNERPIQ